MIRINRRTAVIAHDLFMVALAWELAWLARFNFSFSAVDWQANLSSLPSVLITQGVILWPIGLYRGLWRFASLPDLWNIVRAAVFGAVASMLVLFLATRLQGVPRSMVVLYPLFLVFLLGGPRLGYRLWKDRALNLKALHGGRRVLVIGAGRAGEMLVRDMRRDGQYCPVGLLDDQQKLRNTQIHGVSVLDGVERLADVVRLHDVEFIVIAVPSATNAQMRRFVELCERSGKPFRTLPRLSDMVQGESAIKALREVAINDLLGRDKVRLDWHAIQSGLTGKVVMVSGGGGSIGSELCRQIARLGPDSLVVFERNEYNLYRVEMELRQQFPSVRLHALLGDVSDAAAVENALATHVPEVIFHAAAYKHVPILQCQAREAARNNVLGTVTLARAAIRRGCKKFVLISTDKAVNPTSVMGTSKRVAEICCEAFNQLDGTRFVTVRFGNVLGSAGSVVPLFQEQIRNGGPVTVTHPEMTRYFMTIPEAAQLILQAGAMGQGGEIFVLNMGEPVHISYLAEQLIRLSGREPGKDIRIEYVGLRPGERLREELFHQDERLEQTAHNKILLARHRPAERLVLERALAELADACDRFDEDRIGALLKNLVPEMIQADSETSKVIALQKGVL